MRVVKAYLYILKSTLSSNSETPIKDLLQCILLFSSCMKFGSHKKFCWFVTHGTREFQFNKQKQCAQQSTKSSNKIMV
jgi:hypothetical protein